MKGRSYVELTVSTNFSFLQGASPPERLVQRAAALGSDVVAVTDRDGLYGAVRAHEEALKLGIRLIIGAELTVGDAPPFTTLTVLVQNHEGYTNLCRILTESHKRHRKGKPRTIEEGLPRNVYAGISFDFVCAHADGLWALAHDYDLSHVTRLREAFGERTSVALFRHASGEDRIRARRACEVSERAGVPLVATNAVRFATRDEKPIHDVLHCIRENVTLDEAGRGLLRNAEACLKGDGEMRRLFRDLPEAVTRTRDIADACRFSLSELNYQFPSQLDDAEGAPRETPDERLRRLTYEGAKVRYPEGTPESVRVQIERELTLISHLDVAPYFLSVRSIIDMARRRDILCQGRGSAANSAVCFCLGVTAVDPARTNLLFERFLSAERHEPPDIDVDFEHDRREEVIQEIYDTYGRDRAAMVSEVVCYRGRSALRDVGKVFGLSLEQVERLSATVSFWDQAHAVDARRLRDAGFDAKDDRLRLVITTAQAIQGFPRHLSIHVGGFVLSADPLDKVAPVEQATMVDRTVVPWDKDDIDTLKFFKVDVLGLGILTAIRRGLALACPDDERLRRAPTAIDRLAAIPPEDPLVYDALCKGDSVGVFQVESRAQMSMLPRLLPRNFYDLVVEVAIVRPGPIQGGMVHPYLRRRTGEEEATAPHPSLAPILDRTLGVPLFQEQVMQIAIVGAGYSGGEANQLRRDMAAWKRNGRLEQHRERLTRGFLERGISLEFADRLYAQIQGFGEYGFPESHAASFALLVYASAWLKVHHPAAFVAGLLNSQPMGFYSASTLLQDAQRHGVEVRPICIERSDWDCTLERDGHAGDDGERDDGTGGASSGASGKAPSLRVGLRQIKGLGEEAGRRIEKARCERAFANVEDLAARAALSGAELDALAESGALAPLFSASATQTVQTEMDVVSVDRSRREAMWKVRVPQETGLLAGVDSGESIPRTLRPLTRTEQLSLDFERTGFSVTDHPMKLYRSHLPKGVKNARELQAMPHGRQATVAGFVICRQRPMTASGVVFVTMEDEFGFLNLLLWTKTFEKFHHVATTSSLLLARGKVERQGDVVYVLASHLEPLRTPGPPMPSMSRDFH